MTPACNCWGDAAAGGGTAATLQEDNRRRRTPTAKRTTTRPGDDFEAFVRKCSEADGGDDDDGTICDAVWSDAEVLFADGTFGCTTTRSVTITCTWDADGGMAVGRNALPGDHYNLLCRCGQRATNFLKCEAE